MSNCSTRSAGGTSLQELVERAQITKGAFYHFNTKQAVASRDHRKAESLFSGKPYCGCSPTLPLSALDNVITLTFVIPRCMFRTNSPGCQQTAAVAGSGQWCRFRPPTTNEKKGLPAIDRGPRSQAAAAYDIRDGIDVDKLGWTMWACRGRQPVAVGDATDADIIGCTADMWEIILFTIVAENLPHFRGAPRAPAAS